MLNGWVEDDRRYHRLLLDHTFPCLRETCDCFKQQLHVRAWARTAVCPLAEHRTPGDVRGDGRRSAPWFHVAVLPQHRRGAVAAHRPGHPPRTSFWSAPRPGGYYNAAVPTGHDRPPAGFTDAELAGAWLGVYGCMTFDSYHNPTQGMGAPGAQLGGLRQTHGAADRPFGWSLLLIAVFFSLLWRYLDVRGGARAFVGPRPRRRPCRGYAGRVNTDPTGLHRPDRRWPPAHPHGVPVLRHAGTEPAFSGEYTDTKTTGVYRRRALAKSCSAATPVRIALRLAVVLHTAGRRQNHRNAPTPRPVCSRTEVLRQLPQPLGQPPPARATAHLDRSVLTASTRSACRSNPQKNR